MGLFSNQFANVVEWEEYRDDVIFWKWTNREIKKDSKLIIKPGQDAIFLYNGAVEGIFTESGNYTIDSQIIPFLSTLKGFKFGFNSGLRAEVLFVNTKEFTCNWGTSSPIRLQAPGLPGGLPVRSNGKFPVFHRNRPPISNVGEIIAYPFPKHNVQKKKRAKPSFFIELQLRPSP